VHLKSYVTYLGEGCFLGIEKYQNQPVFDGYRYLVIPQSESYASNTLTVNCTVIIPKGYPHTKQLLTENGFDTITLDTKEFARCEGALTCLSIIF
ncbi:MAG: amidinotransferase, partial [Candidatus Thorarchaeota archaeon]